MDRSARHGPTRLSNYIDIHETARRRFLDTGEVDEDLLPDFDGVEGRYLLDEGVLILRDRRLRLTVTKVLEAVDSSDPDDPLVQTIAYSYNVSVIGRGCVFRYCSPHGDHNEQHHRHEYDFFGPDPDENTVSFITDGDWPTLSQVVREADEWYGRNRDAL